MKVKRFDIKKEASSINEDAIFGGQKTANQKVADSPNAVLNSDEAVVIGPDGKTYNMQGIKENVKFIYTAIVREYPALSYFIAMLEPVYTFDVPTMATDGFNIYINPFFYVKLQSIAPYLAPTYVILHELYHNLLCHMKREKERGGEFPNHRKCNYAQDEEINNILEEQDPGFKGLTAKIGGICDYEYKGMIWEDIYPLLKDEEMEQPPTPGNGKGNQQGSQGQMSNGQNQQSGQGEGQDQQQGQDGQGQGQQSQSQQGQQGQGLQGGQIGPQQGQGNQISPGTGVPDTTQQGRYSDVLSRAEGEKIAQRAGKPYTDEQKNENADSIWEKAISGANGQELSRMPAGPNGTGLYSTIKKVIEMFKPVMNWKKELEKYMNEAFSEEDIKFPQKKYISSGRYKRYEDDVEDGLRDICVMFDASGSAWRSGYQEQFLTEIDSILKKTKVQSGVVAQFADGVSREGVFNFKRKLPREAFDIRITGGTNYNKALTWANDYFKKKIPGCVICFSDDGIFDEDLSKTHFKWMDKKLIWVIIDSGNDPEKVKKKIPYGKVLVIPEKLLPH